MNLRKNELFNLQRWLFLTIIIIVYSNIVFCGWNMDWIKPRLLLKSGRSDSNVENFNFNKLPGKILGFIDFNNDKFTDIIVYDESAIHVLLWNSTKNDFLSRYFFEFKYKIVSSFPGDWDGDGNVDILITYYIQGGSKITTIFSGEKSRHKLGMALFARNGESDELIEIWRTNDESELSIVEPLVFDLNGDGMLDLLCESEDGKRFVLLNFYNFPDLAGSKSPFRRYDWGRDLSEWIDINDSSVNERTYGTLVENHSSSFIDIDGDCRSDLVLEVYYVNDYDENRRGFFEDQVLGSHETIVKKGLEIWINTIVDGVAKFKRYIPKVEDTSTNNSGLIILPDGSGSISYSDFNRDGTIDLIIPVCTMGRNGCESKSRLVFVPNIHEYRDCVADNTVNFFGLGGDYKYRKKNGDPSYKCKHSKTLCRSSPFEIHSFTEEDNSLIFQDAYVTEKKKQSGSFFSSLFGGKSVEKDSKPETTLHNGFTVSLIYENDGLYKDNSVNGIIMNDVYDKKQGEENSDELGNTVDSGNQLSVVANQMVSLFSLFPSKQGSKNVELQWGERNDRETIVLSVGDFNLDGYPDILAVVKYPNNTRQIKLIENMPIMFNNNNDLDNGHKTGQVDGEGMLWYYDKLLGFFRKTLYWFSGFVLNPEMHLSSDSVYRRFGVSRTVNTYSGFSVDYGAFFDIYDNGFLDIISVSYPDSSSNEYSSQVSVRFASTENPNLFIKVSALSYIYSAPRGYISNEIKKNGSNNGITSYGTTIKIRMTSLTGKEILMSSAQFSQSTNGVLQTPFVVFGLGKTNNYIEELNVGTNYAGNSYINLDKKSLETPETQFNAIGNLGGLMSLFDHSGDGLSYKYEQFAYSNVWTGLIPNTRVIAQLSPLDNPQLWTLVLSVSPKKSLKGILIVSAFALLVIGAIVLILDQKEKAEDLKEHQGFKSNFISA